MLPDRVSNPGPLTYESGALPIALRGPARLNFKRTKRHLLSFGMLYFQHLSRFLYSPKISDYPRLNKTMNFLSTYITEDLSFGKVLSSYCFFSAET